MTPDLRTLATLIDQHFPRLRQDNTYQTAGEFTWRVQALGVPEWAPVGKTQGESQWLPPGFIPYTVTLTDPQGIARSVTITGWSQDALWHLPSKTQVKVLSNSAAKSDPDPAIWSAANIACYVIPSEGYRWHNPPVPLEHQPALPSPNPVPGTGTPAPTPTPHTPAPGILAKDLAYQLLLRLNAYYASTEGLQRPGGMVLANGEVDLEAVAQWFYQAVIEGRTFDQIVAQIQLSDEYRRKHGLI